MTENLSAQLEYSAHDQFGSIVGSFVLQNMPDIYTPEDASIGFIAALVGIQLPIRGKLNDLYSSDHSSAHFVADTILEIQPDDKRAIIVYGMDALAELDNLGRSAEADIFDRYGWMKLGFTAAQGTLAPLPRLLAA